VEIVNGISDFRSILADLKKEKKGPFCGRDKSFLFFASLYRPFFHKINRFNPLGNAVFQQFEIIDSQVLDKIPVLENPNWNFNVDNDGLFGDLLGKDTKAKQGKTANAKKSLQTILLAKEVTHNRIEVKILFPLSST
jgi:hypothetical protein